MDELITISKAEYDNLKYNDAVANFFVEVLKNASKLNYAGDGLYFNDSVLDTAVKILLPDIYKDLLYRLQEQKAANDLFDKGETRSE